MHRLNAFLLLGAIAAPGALGGGGAPSPSFSFTGTISQDTDQREVFFTLPAAGNVLMRTFSYSGGINGAGTTIPRGGFDTTLSLFDATGRLVAANEDGGCALVAPDAVTGMCWDAYMALQLPAGNYRLVLTQSTNTANGPTLADGFHSFCSFADQSAGNCIQNFTPDPNPGVLPSGFWDESRDRRVGTYAVDVAGVTTATAPSITSSPTLPAGAMGQAYPGFTFAVQPNGTFTWTVVAGALPPGLALDPNSGILSGTPSASGVFTFTIQASDGVESLQQTVTLTVAGATTPPGSVSITTTALPPGAVGQNYGPFAVVASGGSGSYSWTAANLPAGLTISTSGGQISGIPLSAGTTTNIVITVTDLQTSATASSGPLSLTITSNILSVTSSGTSGEIVLGSGVSAAFTATGGTAPYTWSSSNLPPGLVLNPATGALTGTPLQPGNFNFNILVTDSQSPHNTLSYPFSLQVFGLATPSILPGAIMGIAYSQTLLAAGGRPPYSFSSPNLPPGLSLAGSTLTGTPTTAGTFTFTVQITDGGGLVASSPETLVVGTGGALSVSGGALAGGTVLLAYTQTLPSTGGAPPVSWTIIAGTLPNGLSLTGSGVVSGTPYRAGSFVFTAQATDSAGASASAVFTIVIAPAPLAISGLTVPHGISGTDYPLQILMGSGGTAPYTFTYTGNLPPGLTFANGQLSGIPTASGTYSVSITLADAGVPALSITSPLQIVINPAGTDLILSAGGVSFLLTTGSSGLPGPQNVTVGSSDVLQLLNYSVTTTPAAPWLDVTGGGTTTPGSITIALDASATALPASTTALTAAVVVTCLAPSACAGKAQTILVTLNVPSPAPQLLFTSSLIQFSTLASNPQSLSQPVGLENPGAGSSPITSVTAADSWLTVTGVPSAVAGGPPVSLIFTANPAGLGAGFFRTIVTANSPAGSATIPVTLFITQAPTLLLSAKGAQFHAVLGGSPGNIQGSFQVSAAGGAAVGFTASVLPGASWLSLSAGSASGSTNPSQPQTIGYTLDRSAIAALSPAGTYYGTIQLVAAGAANSPQTFEVVLMIAPAGSLPTPDPQPGGLIFTLPTGGAGAPSQDVAVYSDSAAATPYSASASTVSGGLWLSVTPGTGTASPLSPGVSVISVNPGTLAPGVYEGSVSYQFSAAAVRTVTVTMIVEAAACTPKQLVATITNLVSNFSLTTGLPTPLTVKVLEDCGLPVGNAQITAAFSNGDAPLQLTLTDASAGLYSGTWTPQAVSPQTTVSAMATAPGLGSSVAQVTGQIGASGAPILTMAGAVHIYDPLLGGAVAPGTILSIYGSNLALQALTNTMTSLPTILGGTSVTIGGILAPLYYVSPSQIDAEVPVELLPGDQYEVIINANGALSTAGSLNIIAASPGVAAYPTGQAIAQHLDYSLVSANSPAKPGEYVVIYLAGLGLTDNPVVDGAPSPSSPLAHPLIAPVLTLNGIAAPIAFAGLTPAFAGLYQINFQVPLTTPNGDISLVVSQSNVPGNSTILPVHN